MGGLISLRWGIVFRPSGKWEAARMLIVRGKPYILRPAMCGAPSRSRADALAMAADLNRNARA